MFVGKGFDQLQNFRTQLKIPGLTQGNAGLLDQAF